MLLAHPDRLATPRCLLMMWFSYREGPWWLFHAEGIEAQLPYNVSRWHSASWTIVPQTWSWIAIPEPSATVLVIRAFREQAELLWMN